MFRNFINTVKREISIISKDRNIFTIIILVPIFYTLMYGSLYWNKTENKLPVIVVDMDRTEFSKEFTKRLNSHQLVDVISVTGDLSEAKLEMDRMEVHGIVYIPVDAEKSLDSKKSITITSYLNTTRFLVSNDINKAVNEIATYYSYEKREIYLKSTGYSSREAESLTEPVKADVRAMFNRTETYGDFLIPGIIALVLHQTLLLGLSENIARERQNNLILEYKSVSGNSSIVALLGKSAFYFLMYFSYSLLFFTIAFTAFKINMLGSLTLLIVITSLMILSAVFLSILFSSFFKRKYVALIIMAFSTYPLFLITGYSLPLYTLPVPLQYLSNMFTITPYLNAYVRLTQLGAGFENIKSEILSMGVITFVLFVLALIRLKYLFIKLNKL
jgi:ABC-2 type transport system permease protein